MKEKIANLKNMELKTWSLLSAIVADCIYVLNLILRIRKFSKLDETIPDENSEIERGLTEYISSHQSEQILFMIGVLILETKNPVFSERLPGECRNNQEINDFSTPSGTTFHFCFCNKNMTIL